MIRNAGGGLALLAGGLALGLAPLHPAAAPLAWLGIAALVVAVDGRPARLRTALGLVGALLLARAVMHPWAPDMNVVLFGHGRLAAWGLYAAEVAATAGGPALSVALTYRLIGGRVPAALWLPPAWLLGEALTGAVVAVRTGDWLVSQWAVPPVLRLLGHLGHVPTVLLCLAAAAGLGHALARRRPLLALPIAALLVLGVALPPLPPRVEALRGLGALHTRSVTELPAAVPAGVEVVVWPEGALFDEPLRGEGGGGRLALGLGATWQVLGLVTRRPDGRRQNQALVVDPTGMVVGSRAKRVLFPLAERRFLGMGTDAFIPGAAGTVQTVAGRRLATLICGEVLDRGLVAEAAAGGAEALVVLARDQMLLGAAAQRQILGVQILRSVEFGLPSVRASYGGEAAFITAAGEVLARTQDAPPGLLSLGPNDQPTDVDLRGPQPPPGPAVAILYDPAFPTLQGRCPAGRCTWSAIDTPCDGAQADTVIVAGHGFGDTVLGRSPEVLAARVACLRPRLVVIDACLGAAIDVLQALVDAGLEGAQVVASAALLPTEGLSYPFDFYDEPDPAHRATRVAPGQKLLRGPVTQAALTAARQTLQAMTPEARWRHLARRNPPLVQLETETLGAILLPVAWAEVGPGRLTTK